MRKTAMVILMCLPITLIAQGSGDGQQWAAARKMCENYGFTPNTVPFAECVQREVHKQASTTSKSSDDENRQKACLERNQRITERVKSCRHNCNVSYLSSFGQPRGRNRIDALNEKNNCEASCDQQLSMQGEC